MARWYRSGRYYGRNRGYRSNYYYKKSSQKSKSWGNMKAAKQQADQSTFTINIPTSFSCFSNTLKTADDKIYTSGVFPLNVFDYLRRSEFFTSYAGMYDEFKIDRIKVKLLPTSFTISSGTDYKNLTVYTAWDRSGVSPEQCLINFDKITDASTAIGASGDDNGVYCLVGEDITTYSSAESRTLNPNTNTSIVRWLNPKTMQEKSQWLSTTSLKKWYENYDPTKGRFYGIPLSAPFYDQQAGMLTTSGATTNAQTIKNTIFQLSPMTSENPCFILEDSGVKFKPTLLIGVYPSIKKYGDDADLTSNNTIKFNAEIEVVCTFRGLRRAKVVA